MQRDNPHRERMARSSQPYLKNWCGTHDLAALDHVLKPGSERELQSILRTRNTRLQIVGNRYSCPALLQSSSALDTTRLSGITSLTGDTVTVAGGTELGALYTSLDAIGRTLPCSPPVICTQTVAGAIATGTHGQGLDQSSLADVVVQMRYVDSHGRVHEVVEGDGDFDAFRLHLGCLGVITSLTLRTVPQELFACEKRAAHYAEFVDEFVHWNHKYRHVKAWWFPETGETHAWLVREANTAETRHHQDSGQGMVANSSPSNTLNAVVDSAITRMKSDTKSEDESRNRFKTLARFKDFTDVTGTLNEILCKGIPAAQINVEVGVPLEAFDRVQHRLADYFAHARTRTHYPVILRATGPSTAWLSPAHERACLYYGFVVYLADDDTFRNGARQDLREIQQILAAEGGLPHWGKYFDADLFNFPAAYARWKDFLRLRQHNDPDRRFLGQFLEGILQ
ncbi:D-arabinono-1,4-lactone oxidase [Streptomyces sp. NPDC050523]|uniref:D-arabinono-1,4-lactone oxidase n=1 Tax=Streptomyces sp. NPDC050523 TaxID=3365622 RepID=UPI0037B735E7